MSTVMGRFVLVYQMVFMLVYVSVHVLYSYSSKGAKTARPDAGVKVTAGADQKRVADNTADLHLQMHMDMKAVTMTAADSKEVTPRGGSAKVRDRNDKALFIC
jgi:hypothetical protein